MDEKNQSGAQHLTSLDLDISGIYTSLQSAQQEIERMSIECGKTLNTQIKKVATEASKEKMAMPELLNSDAIERTNQKLEDAKKKLEEIANAKSKLAKTVMDYDASGNLLGGSITYDDSVGNKIVEKWKMVAEEDELRWQKISESRTNDIAKREKIERAALEKSVKAEQEAARAKAKAEQEAAEKAQQVKDSFYKKNITQVDAEIEERERQGRVFAAQLKERMQISAAREADTKKTLSSLDSMIEKQKKFNSLVARQRTSGINKRILAQSDAYILKLESLISRIKATGNVSEEAKKEIEELAASVKNLSGTYEEAGTKGDSFLRKTIDKAKWLGAFYIVNSLRQAMVESVKTIKEAEDAVVDLQRVLNSDIGKTAVSEELYGIAEQYGRTFQDVSQVSTAFAQAGYDWNDTLRLTEGTMLALNTAELDVESSTKGLISVMQQWNFEASDYADVIDKINITGDRFAVTSENIVSALQRSSSSAKNAGLSFEETVGAITALAEATGRSGENIGTALNSLLIYTGKSKALETFAQVGSDSVKQVVESYKQGAASIFEVWKALSDDVANLESSRSVALFESKEYQDFAKGLEANAEELTNNIKAVYGEAGTYRQNYFIALLQDMDQALEAVEKMTDAEGYSLRENRRYMETLTAQWNQLKDALAELAVQLGETGVLNGIKGIVQLGIGFAKITKDAGGLLRVLSGISGMMLVIKRQKIANRLDDVGSSLKGLRENFRIIRLEMQSATTIADKAKAAFYGLNASISTVTAGIGLAVTAFSLFSNVINVVRERQKREREERLEANREKIESTDNITKLIAAYRGLSEISNRTSSEEMAFRSVNAQIAEALGDRAKKLEGLTAGTVDYARALANLTSAELAERRVTLETQKSEAKKDFLSSATSFYVFPFGDNDAFRTDIVNLKTDNKEVQKVLDETLGEFSKFSKGTDNFYGAISRDEKGLMAWTMGMKKAKEELEKLGSTSSKAAEMIANDPAFKALETAISAINEPFMDFLDSQVQGAINNQMLAQGIPQTTDGFDDFKQAIFEATGADESFRDVIYEIVDNAFPELSGRAHQAGDSLAEAFSISEESINAVSDAIKELNGEIDGFQSAYSAATAALEEYNETGTLSIDTIQNLLSAGSEYASLLSFTENGVSLNQQALESLIEKQRENVDALIVQTTHAGLLEIAQRYLGETTDDLAESSADAAPEVEVLDSKLADLANTAVAASFDVAAAGAAIDEAFNESERQSNYNAMKSEMADYLKTMNQFSRAARSAAQSQGAWSKSASNGARQAARDAERAQRKALEDQKKAIKERYDKEIEALRKLKAEKDRQRKEDEYYRNRQNALKEIGKAETRSGVEFREREEEAREKLADLDRKHLQELEDFAIEDRIKELEALRDAELAAVDQQLDKISNAMGNVGSSTVKSFSTANKTNLSNYEKEYLEPFKEETKEAYSDVYSELPAVFGDSLESMLEMVKLNSMQMYNVYNDNFFSKMRSSMAAIQMQMMPFATQRPLFPSVSPNRLDSYYPHPNVTTNTTRNATMFASFYGNQSADRTISRFFTQP